LQAFHAAHQLVTMKSFAVALVAALAGSAHGFAPAPSAAKASFLRAEMPADYEGLIGISNECGNKFVSILGARFSFL